MSDELLPYYNRELAYIRRLAARFAERHPKIAGRLRLGVDTSDDPHVERLIEAFSYLTARVRQKIDDDFPEITESLLGVLYPHYQAPIPSMSIVQFDLDREQTQLTSGYVVPRHTEIETEPIQGEPCRFRTCYPVTLWPIDVRSAGLFQAPAPAPSTPRSGEAAAVLRIVLDTRAAESPFSTLALGSLRFFIKAQAQHVFHLHELILNNTIEVALARSSTDKSPVVLSPDCLKPVGFERDEGMLPYTPRSFAGYRLLTEFFAFAPKFLFFELTGLSQRVLSTFANRLEVYLYWNRSVADPGQYVSEDTFRLGCAPVVNLFEQRAEPIRLTQREFEYRVVPDARRPKATEVYSIDRVTASPPEGESVEFLPFFAICHARRGGGENAYWHMTRRPAENAEGIGDSGSEVFLSLVDPEFQPDAPADWTAEVRTTCLNRDLPYRLPFGGNQPRLQLGQGGALIAGISMLLPPTRTLRPALARGALWRLISHLSLNHLSLTGDDGEADALREILLLYDFSDSPATRKLIDGILGISSRRVVGNTREGGRSSFCRGIEITVVFDDETFHGGGLYLLACVLERFFPLYASINSFTTLVATTNRPEGEVRRWPPRMGEELLV